MRVPVWAVAVAGAHAACAPAVPANGQTVTCTDATPAGFVAPVGVTGLTVSIQTGATVGSQQTSAGANPSFTKVRVNGTSTVNNAGTIANTTPSNRDNFGVNLAGDLSTLNNTGTITLTAPAGNTTTRIYGAYSSAPGGSQYASTTMNNSATVSNTTAGEAAIATFALNAGNAGDATTLRAYNTLMTNTVTGVINGDPWAISLRSRAVGQQWAGLAAVLFRHSPLGVRPATG